ncbi:MAG: ATP-binding protein, partial [Kangiellaceae bacterium]|nr:ATP-binding protein [Kangiellaceae bacterium]
MKQTLNNGKILFSDLEKYRFANHNVSGFMTARLLGDSGKVEGVLAVAISVKQINNLLRDGSSSFNSEVSYLIGTDLLLRSDIYKQTDSDVLLQKIQTPQTKLWREEHVKDAIYSDDQIEQAFVYPGISGEQVLGIHQSITIGNVLWGLIVEVNESEAMLPIAKLAKLTGWLVVFLILAVFALAIFTASRLTRPLRKIVSITEQAAVGELDFQIELKANNELDQLIESLNLLFATRRIHESALEESNIKTKRALERLEEQKFALDQHAVVDVCDTSGKITFVNEKFCSLFGFSEEEMLGKTHAILNSGYHGDEFFEELFDTIQKGEVWRGEIKNRNKDGAHFWVDTTIVPFMSVDGTPESYISIRTDITDRKKAELESAKTLSLVEATLDSTDNGILATDMEGGLINFNQRFSELWCMNNRSTDAISLRYILKKMLSQLAQPQALICRIKETKGNLFVNCHDVLRCKDGRVFEMVTSPMLMQGIPQGRVWSFHDITHQKKTEGLLIKAKNEADEANKVKSEFLATMSHEIRTPMNGVLGMLQLLDKNELSANQKHYLNLATSSAKSLLAVINDILDFSKIEAGKLSIESIVFNPTRLISEVVQSNSLLAQKKNIELITDLSGIKVKEVSGDPNRIRQIFINLLSNAIKFTAKGSVYIEAAIKCDEVNDQAIFSGTVRDSGIGISKDKLPVLFQAFSQADSSTTRRFGGSGLGLTICKQLCRLMGGDIQAESKEDEGSEFTFSIKVAIDTKIPNSPDVSAVTSLDLISPNKALTDNLLNQFEAWSIPKIRIFATLDEWLLASQSTTETISHVIFDPEFESVLEPDSSQAKEAVEVFYDTFSRLPKAILGMISNLGKEEHLKNFDINNRGVLLQRPITPIILSDFVEGKLSASSKSENIKADFLRQKQAIEGNNTAILLVEDNLVNQEVALGILEEFGYQVIIANNGQEALDILHKRKSVKVDLVLMDCQMPV